MWWRAIELAVHCGVLRCFCLKNASTIRKQEVAMQNCYANNDERGRRRRIKTCDLCKHGQSYLMNRIPRESWLWQTKKRKKFNETAEISRFRSRQLLFGSTPSLSHSRNLCIVFRLHGKRLRNRIGMLINEIGAKKMFSRNFSPFDRFCLLCDVKSVTTLSGDYFERIHNIYQRSISTETIILMEFL